MGLVLVCGVGEAVAVTVLGVLGGFAALSLGLLLGEELARGGGGDEGGGVDAELGFEGGDWRGG